MKKRALTLLEIMIVIFLITLIAGAIGYNMKGALEKGKAFRTERAMEQVKDLLLYRVAEIGNLSAVLSNPKKSIEETGLAKDPESLLKDGWGEAFIITQNRSRSDFKIRSKKLEEYNQKHQRAASSLNEEAEDSDDL